MRLIRYGEKGVGGGVWRWGEEGDVTEAVKGIVRKTSSEA